MAKERHLNIDGRQPDKKQAVAAGGAKKGRKMPLIAAALIAAAFAGAVIFSGGKGGFTVVEASDGVVKIPVSTVGDGHAKYFSYGQTGINFFVLRSSDGVLRVAFDACDVCYREKKGYRQEGDIMVCNNCGQAFPSTQINVIRGGCNPAPIERQVEGDHLLMRASDIEAGRMYF